MLVGKVYGFKNKHKKTHMCTAWHAQHVLAIGVLSQSVVQPIAGAGMQLGRETGWYLIFMEIVWEIYSQNTYFVWI